MSGTYVRADELRSVIDLIDYLNSGALSGDISIHVGISDSNGETIGYVRICESGEYAFHTQPED